jgi:4-hydroxy-tetrahydrodipicolinate synthase
MNSDHPLAGVHAAAVTPLHADGTPDLPGLAQLLAHLAGRGCHGALILGTTGEGPSFATPERLDILRAALRVRETHVEFRLLAGTGTPSLEETVLLTRSAFDLGYDAAVVLPPYYFRSVADDGLLAWYEAVLRRAVPAGKSLLGYHIPGISGVPLSLDLIAALQDRFPDRFAGIKDSSADGEFARRLGQRFGAELLALNGTDTLFADALDHGAGGCITAAANLISPDLRLVWEAHRAGGDREPAMVRVRAARAVLERFPPLPAIVKALLARLFDFPRWPVRLPLRDSAKDAVERAAADLLAAGIR